MTPSDEPLLEGVIVAIPTFNRSQALDRAARSVLAQDHRDVIVMISDNASVDDTPRVCAVLAADDPRVRIYRQRENIGLTANFNWLMRQALQLGRDDAFFMFLGDDDWLEPGYVRACIKAFRPGHSMTAGRTLCHMAGECSWYAPDVHLDAEDGLHRVADLCREVLPTGVFSGLIPLDTLARLPPQRNVIGNDWLLFANIAFLGKVVTADQATINRSAGGASTTPARLAATLGVSRIQAFKPLLTVGTCFLLECFSRSPVFTRLPLRRRVRLISIISISLVERRVLSMRKRSPTRAIRTAEALLRHVRTGLIHR